MPLPKPNEGEERNDFTSRCMGDSVMNKEYQSQDQRFAVCNSLWTRKRTSELSKELEDMSK